MTDVCNSLVALKEDFSSCDLCLGQLRRVAEENKTFFSEHLGGSV